MTKITVENISLSFGNKQVLREISFDVKSNSIVALIGPSGCGKSTLLRCMNRMHDLQSDVSITGHIKLDNDNIYNSKADVNDIRTRIGMVFQKPNPFPKSIFDNVAFGLRVNGIHNKHQIQARVEESLKDAFLWEEVKDKLHQPALSLSGGQQQRLCIARCIAIKPEVILMDEPTSALDPIATQRIEELTLKLKKDFTIIIVTHNMQQAQRIADKIAMLYLGDLIEFTETHQFFTNPQHELAQKYVSGEFG
ncbi:MAG: phosphate ABC transporter ATP-binding protein PstB [Flammeovirgaceae bacterium]